MKRSLSQFEKSKVRRELKRLRWMKDFATDREYYEDVIKWQRAIETLERSL